MTDGPPAAPDDPRPIAAPPGGVRALRWVITLLLVLAGVSCVTKGANSPPDPVLRSQPAGEPGAEPASNGRTPFGGYGEVTFQVKQAGQLAPAIRCALLARTPDQHARGLMNVTDLKGYDGMLFVFPADVDDRFYMKDTPLPLSIAWFDANGRFVSSADMEPCLNNPDCPLYPAARPYRYALEVPKGGLGRLGIGPGSEIVLGGDCP